MGRIISPISYYVNRKTVIYFFTVQKWSTGTPGDFVLTKDLVLHNFNTNVANQ